jgi:uncharacterized protein (DUF58 family)
MTGLLIAAVFLIAVFGFSLLQKEIYQRFWNKNLVYSLRSSKNAVFEGEKVILTDSLTNGKRLPLPWVHVSYRLSQYVMALDNIGQKSNRGERRDLVFIVGMNKTVNRKSTVLCRKRGYYTASDHSVSCNNLFMTDLITETPKLSSFGLLVYPRLVDYPESVIPLSRMLGDVPVRRFIDPDPFTFKGIREYQPYDSFRQINWAAAAKMGVLMSNIYDFTVSQEFTVLLDLQEYSKYNRDFVHEEAIRLAAFICRQCIGMGIPVSLVCPAADGSPMRISGGLTKAHLESIYAGLAYIDLKARNMSVAGHIPKSSDKAYILISSCGEKAEVAVTAGGNTFRLEVRADAQD